MSISPDQLKELLQYDPATGSLFWKPRGSALFGSESACAWWNSRYANKPALNSLKPKGYLRGSIFDRVYSAHRVVWALVNNEWPEGEIDHINGIRSDNRIANLRVVSRAENRRNQQIPHNSTSGQVGVVWQKRQRAWYASIGFNNSKIHLGSFRNKEDAIAARKAAEQKYGYHENHGRAILASLQDRAAISRREGGSDPIPCATAQTFPHVSHGTAHSGEAA